LWSPLQVIHWEKFLFWWLIQMSNQTKTQMKEMIVVE
jgi:hypothetical protein